MTAPTSRYGSGLPGNAAPPHDFSADAPVVLIYGADTAVAEERLVYEDLLHGTFRQAQGYPCTGACGGWNPARSVTRLDFPPWRETLLYAAPFARKPWMLPDETRTGITRDMSPEAAKPPGRWAAPARTAATRTIGPCRNPHKPLAPGDEPAIRRSGRAEQAAEATGDGHNWGT